MDTNDGENIIFNGDAVNHLSTYKGDRKYKSRDGTKSVVHNQTLAAQIEDRPLILLIEDSIRQNKSNPRLRKLTKSDFPFDHLL